jgi:hypothetical protein
MTIIPDLVISFLLSDFNPDAPSRGETAKELDRDLDTSPGDHN